MPNLMSWTKRQESRQSPAWVAKPCPTARRTSWWKFLTGTRTTRRRRIIERSSCYFLVSSKLEEKIPRRKHFLWLIKAGSLKHERIVRIARTKEDQELSTK